MQIYKIFRDTEWQQFQTQGHSKGAPIDLSDGYIHISTADQVAETVAKHFAGEADLMILALNSDALGDALIWEPSRGGALFPHLYRDLNIADVIWSTSLPLGPDGHIFPDGVL